MEDLPFTREQVTRILENIATEEILTSSTLNEKVLFIEIFNTTGSVILQEKSDFSIKKIDIRSLNPGIYYLKINGQKHLRFIKNELIDRVFFRHSVQLCTPIRKGIAY